MTEVLTYPCIVCGGFHRSDTACPNTAFGPLKASQFYPYSATYTFLPQYLAYGEAIGVEPWPEEDKKVKAVGTGFKVVEQKNSLKGLRVLIGSEKYPVGSMVFLAGEGYTQQWAKKVYVVDGMSFILCPLNYIQFVRIGEPAKEPSVL